MIFYSFFELSRFHWLLELNNQTLGKKGVIEISLVGVIANKKRIKKKRNQLRWSADESLFNKT